MARAVIVFAQTNRVGTVLQHYGSTTIVLTTVANTSVASRFRAPNGRGRNGKSNPNTYNGGTASITAEGGSLWVDIGPDPIAVVPTENTEGTGHYIPEGQTLDLGLRGDDRIAICDWV